MAHGLALDHAAWSSPWRSRSVRDKGVLSLGLLVAAISLPAWPGGAAVAVAGLVLLLGPIRVGWARLGRIIWLPVVSILIGVATVAVSVSWDGGLRLQLTSEGIDTAGRLAVRALAATLAMFTLACSTPMIDLLNALRHARVPDALIEIAALIYRFSFGLLEERGHDPLRAGGAAGLRHPLGRHALGLDGRGGAVSALVGSGPAARGRTGRARL